MTSTKLVSSLLLVAFIVMKISKVISWAWVWVLSPLWITFLIAVFFATVSVLLKRYVKKMQQKKVEAIFSKWETMLKEIQKKSAQATAANATS